MSEGVLIYGMALREQRINSALRPKYIKNTKREFRTNRFKNSSITRKFYLSKMAKFIGLKIKKTLEDGSSINVVFTKIGNKHLYSDTFGRSRILQKGDLLMLPSILDKATHIKSSKLSKERDDNFTHFHYFRVRLHGKYVFLNVAQETKEGKRKYHIKNILYAVTDRIKDSQ